MLGYLDDPALTQASFADGYFRTGDLARLTAAGHVELIGRAKDIVSRGGHKIAPLEIDNLLAEHPAVAAALCAGVRTNASARSSTRSWCLRARLRGIAYESLRRLRAWLLARTEIGLARFRHQIVAQVGQAGPTCVARGKPNAIALP